MVGAIFLALGAIELVLGIFFYFRTRSFLERAVEVQGTVTGHVESRSSDSGTTYRPTVQYTSADGQSQEFTDRMGSSPPSHDVGESVPVKYDPQNPGKARIGTAGRLWLIPVILSSSGVLFLAIGGFLAAAGI